MLPMNAIFFCIIFNISTMIVCETISSEAVQEAIISRSQFFNQLRPNFIQSPIQQQQTAYSHRPNAAYHYQGLRSLFDNNNRDNFYHRGNADEEKINRFYTVNEDDGIVHQRDSSGLLGSGNFAVLKGGTFYANGRKEFNNRPYHNNNNRYHNSGKQFDNFRDFAEINPNSAYSELVLLYKDLDKKNKKNDKVPLVREKNDISPKEPSNINEQLELLALERQEKSKSKFKKLNKNAKTETLLALN